MLKKNSTNWVIAEKIYNSLDLSLYIDDKYINKKNYEDNKEFIIYKIFLLSKNEKININESNYKNEAKIKYLIIESLIMLKEIIKDYYKDLIKNYENKLKNNKDYLDSNEYVKQLNNKNFNDMVDNIYESYLKNIDKDFKEKIKIYKNYNKDFFKIELYKNRYLAFIHEVSHLLENIKSSIIFNKNYPDDKIIHTYYLLRLTRYFEPDENPSVVRHTKDDKLNLETFIISSIAGFVSEIAFFNFLKNDNQNFENNFDIISYLEIIKLNKNVFDGSGDFYLIKSIFFGDENNKDTILTVENSIFSNKNKTSKFIEFLNLRFPNNKIDINDEKKIITDIKKYHENSIVYKLFYDNRFLNSQFNQQINSAISNPNLKGKIELFKSLFVHISACLYNEYIDPNYQYKMYKLVLKHFTDNSKKTIPAINSILIDFFGDDYLNLKKEMERKLNYKKETNGKTTYQEDSIDISELAMYFFNAPIIFENEDKEYLEEDLEKIKILKNIINSYESKNNIKKEVYKKYSKDI